MWNKSLTFIITCAFVRQCNCPSTHYIHSLSILNVHIVESFYDQAECVSHCHIFRISWSHSRISIWSSDVMVGGKWIILVLYCTHCKPCVSTGSSFHCFLCYRYTSYGLNAQSAKRFYPGTITWRCTCWQCTRSPIPRLRVSSAVRTLPESGCL